MGTLPCRPTLKTPGDMKVFGSFLCSPSRGVTKSVNRRPSFPIHCLLSSSPTFPDVFLALPQYLYKKRNQQFSHSQIHTHVQGSRPPLLEHLGFTHLVPRKVFCAGLRTLFSIPQAAISPRKTDPYPLRMPQRVKQSLLNWCQNTLFSRVHIAYLLLK